MNTSLKFYARCTDKNGWYSVRNTRPCKTAAAAETAGFRKIEKLLKKEGCGPTDCEKKPGWVVEVLPLL